MENQELLKKIAQNVLLKSGCMSDMGLANGKMGVVLFLMHYARWADNQLYEEYAGLLLDDIYSHLNSNLTISIEDGLCGIGWGTEYLLQNHFAEGDADDILGEIDRIVMERDPVRISDLSLETGLAGIFEYALIRIRAKSVITERKLFDDAYLNSLQQAAMNVLKNTEDVVCRDRAKLLLAGIEQPLTIPIRQISDVIYFETPVSENLWQRSDALKNGNAGVGLRMILKM